MPDEEKMLTSLLHYYESLLGQWGRERLIRLKAAENVARKEVRAFLRVLHNAPANTRNARRKLEAFRQSKSNAAVRNFCEVARRLKALRDASETRGPGVTHGPAR